MENRIHNSNFFKGGNALFTVGNNTGKHYTFKIKKGKRQDSPYFVSLLTGQENSSDKSFTYMGILNPLSMYVYLTKKTKFNETSTPVKVIRWAIKLVHSHKSIPVGYSIQHEGRCCRCGRVLTSPESIERGIGPECIKFGKF